ncbi:MAG: hypothetical protein RLZZ424_569 [Bacteroidota bacterium]
MSVVDLILPKLGESIMEATILKWHKAVGDTIQLSRQRNSIHNCRNYYRNFI